jgi:hypothetical protein
MGDSITWAVSVRLQGSDLLSDPNSQPTLVQAQIKMSAPSAAFGSGDLGLFQD